MSNSAQRRLFAGVWISYFTLCMLAFIWPMAGLANTVEPRIGGLPFFLAWYLIWVGVIFLGGVVMYAWDTRLPGGEADDE